MQCVKCKFHFCWMVLLISCRNFGTYFIPIQCLEDWKKHGSEYYECSRYKENPILIQETNHLKARRALERYLHYFERYENHSKSLKMEVAL